MPSLKSGWVHLWGTLGKHCVDILITTSDITISTLLTGVCPVHCYQKLQWHLSVFYFLFWSSPFLSPFSSYSLLNCKNNNTSPIEQHFLNWQQHKQFQYCFRLFHSLIQIVNNIMLLCIVNVRNIYHLY